MRRPVASSSTSIARVLAEQPGHRVLAGPPGPTDDLPRPALLGEWRLGVRDRDPPDPILPVGQREPRELPSETGRPGSLGHEQRELLAGRRRRAGQLEIEPCDGGRRRGPFQTGEEQSLDGLGIRGGLGEALLDDRAPRRVPGAREREVQFEPESARSAARPARSELAGERRARRWSTNRSGSSSSTAARWAARARDAPSLVAA